MSSPKCAGRSRERSRQRHEQWFDDEAALDNAANSPEVAAAWEDVPKYAKTSGSFWVVKEHVILPPPVKRSGSDESWELRR